MNKLFCAVACAASVSVNAGVIDFDSQPDQYFVSPIVDGNYVFTGNYDGLGTNNNSLWPSNGTTHLMSWTNQGSSSGFTMTDSANTIFDVASFDFVGGYVDGRGTVSSLIVSGWLNGSLVNSLTFNAGADFLNSTSYTTLGIAFTGIDALQVEAIGSQNRASFDNIVVNEVVAVPEPSSIALIGLGLIGLGISRKKMAS